MASELNLDETLVNEEIIIVPKHTIRPVWNWNMGGEFLPLISGDIVRVIVKVNTDEVSKIKYKVNTPPASGLELRMQVKFMPLEMAPIPFIPSGVI